MFGLLNKKSEVGNFKKKYDSLMSEVYKMPQANRKFRW